MKTPEGSGSVMTSWRGPFAAVTLALLVLPTVLAGSAALATTESSGACPLTTLGIYASSYAGAIAWHLTSAGGQGNAGCDYWGVFVYQGQSGSSYAYSGAGAHI